MFQLCYLYYQTSRETRIRKRKLDCLGQRVSRIFHTQVWWYLHFSTSLWIGNLQNAVVDIFTKEWRLSHRINQLDNLKGNKSKTQVLWYTSSDTLVKLSSSGLKKLGWIGIWVMDILQHLRMDWFLGLGSVMVYVSYMTKAKVSQVMSLQACLWGKGLSWLY